MRAIDVQAFGLSIRTDVTANPHTFVPRQPQPTEVVDDRLLRRSCRPRHVGVLDAEHERPAGASCQKPVEERRARITDVQLSRRAWGKTQSHALIVGQRLRRRVSRWCRCRWRDPRRTVLASHIVLSITVVPGCLTSFYFAFTRRARRRSIPTSLLRCSMPSTRVSASWIPPDSAARQQRDCVYRNRLARSHRIDTFVGLALY